MPTYKINICAKCGDIASHEIGVNAYSWRRKHPKFDLKPCLKSEWWSIVKAERIPYRTVLGNSGYLVTEYLTADQQPVHTRNVGRQGENKSKRGFI